MKEYDFSILRFVVEKLGQDNFEIIITNKSTRRAGYFGVIAFCEGMKRKRKLLRKERKLSAVKLVSAGENKARMRRT